MLRMRVIEVSFPHSVPALYSDHDLLVWIIGHVLSGWTASEAQFNPSNLCGFLYLASLKLLMSNRRRSLPDVSLA